MSAHEMKKMDAMDIVSARSLGSLQHVEDLFNGKKQKLTRYAVSAVVIGATAGFLFGFDQNVMNAILPEPDFRTQMGMPFAPDTCGTGEKDPLWVSNRLGLVSSLYPIGCAVSAPFAGAINDRFGRYKTLWLGMLVFFVGAALQTGAIDYGMLMAGRMIAGVSVGVLASVVPVYISEIAPHHLRGGLGTTFQLGITTGALFATIWCPIMQAVIPKEADYTWRIEVGLQLVIALVMAIAMIGIPESPRWLFKSGQTLKAKEVLSRLRGEAGSDVTEAEIKEIESEVEVEKSMTSSFTDLFSSKVRLATMVALAVPIMQQLTGINVFMTFSVTIFNDMCLNGLAVAIAQNATNWIASFITVFWLGNRLGRKRGLVYTSCAIFVILLAVCIPGFIIDPITKPLAYGIVVLSCLYCACFQFAWGPNGWIIPNEVFPLRLRGKGTGLATFDNFAFTFIVTYTTPIGVSTIGFIPLMFTYAILNLIGIPLLWFLLPETNNVPLEEMEAKFDLPMKEYIKQNATDLRRRKNVVVEDESPEGKL